MDEHRLEELTNACRKSKDVRVNNRALAVRMVLVNHKSITDTSEDMARCPDWVAKWVARFEEKGVEGLSDLPRSGRPYKVEPKIIRKIIHNKLPESMRPVEIQQEICHVTGTRFHITHVRKIMRRFGLSRKRAVGLHINHASKDEVHAWQKTLNQRISRLEGEGFTVLLQDESFFGRDGWRGQGSWTPVGKPHIVPYVGDYKTIAVMCTITLYGQQMFRTADKVDALTFSFGDMLQVQADCRHSGQVTHAPYQGCDTNKG